MSESKQCSNCTRWIKPLSKSACQLGVYQNQLPFKENGKGIYYCDDFKSKLEQIAVK